MVAKLQKFLFVGILAISRHSFSEKRIIQNENCVLKVFDRTEKKWRKESDLKLKKGTPITVLRKSQLDPDKVLFSTPKSTVFYFEASLKCLENQEIKDIETPSVVKETLESNSSPSSNEIIVRDSWASFGVGAGWYQEPLNVVLLTGAIQRARIFAFYLSPTFEIDSIVWREYGFHFNTQLDVGLGKVGNFSQSDANQISSSQTLFLASSVGLGFDYHFLRDPKSQRILLGIGPDVSGSIRYERLGRIQGGEFDAKDFRLTYGIGLRFLSQISERYALSARWNFYSSTLSHYRAQANFAFIF